MLIKANINLKSTIKNKIFFNFSCYILYNFENFP